MNTHYIIQLFNNNNENWTYTDDYWRIVKCTSEKDAEEKIKDVFSWASGAVISAKIIRVTHEEVSQINDDKHQEIK
jgi:hypothetical protein